MFRSYVAVQLHDKDAERVDALRRAQGISLDRPLAVKLRTLACHNKKDQQAVTDALRSALAAVAPFQAELRGLDVINECHVAIGVHGANALAAAVSAAVKPLGVKQNKVIRPLMLLLGSGGQSDPTCACGTMLVSEVVLVEYSSGDVVARVPLGG
jgi:hypothetical protein